MSRSVDYEDLYSSKKRSILPESAPIAVYNLGQALENRAINSSLILTFRQSLKDIPASAIPKASREIREIGRLYKRGPTRPLSMTEKLLQKLRRQPTSTTNLLENYPDLGWFLIFHGDGHLRQAALETILTAPCSEFEFSAVVHRLNDWVVNVRSAAVKYAGKHFPVTSSTVIGESTFFLLDQTLQLGRWDKDEKAILERAIYRADVLEYLVNKFLRAETGRLGYILQLVLRRPELDGWLQQLSKDAVLPSVRAIATEALLYKRAQWTVGYSKRWIDKVFGLSRQVAEYATREIKVDIDMETLLQTTALDKSAQVRKIAADVLIANRDQATVAMDSVAKKLKEDSNSSVRSRIEFYLRKRQKT